MIAVRDADGGRAGATIGDLYRPGGRGGRRGGGGGAGRPGGHPRPRRRSAGGVRTHWRPIGLPVVDARDMRKGGLSEPLVLLAADAANGLEFDSVVVVEPGVIAGETSRGLRTLYVALTRPTQRLTRGPPVSPPAALAGPVAPPAGPAPTAPDGDRPPTGPPPARIRAPGALRSRPPGPGRRPRR